MKRLVLFLTLVALACAAPSVQAQQKYSLGFGNLALKVDYIRFMDGSLEDLKLENGVYVGVEGYVSVFHPSLYAGVETGWARTEGDFRVFLTRLDLTLDYVPIEFNAKYVFDIDPCLKLDIGAGLSLNYINLEVERARLSASEDDWLFGGQFFADLNYTFPNNLFIGANMKFQLTEDYEPRGIRTDVNANNFRVGGQVGYSF